MEMLFAALNRYAEISSALEEHLRVILHRNVHRKGEIILRKGRVCNRVYFLESGLIRIYSADGKTENTIWILGAGHIFISVRSFFDQTPSVETIKALEDCVLWSITYEELQQTIQRFPEFKDHKDKITEHYYSLSQSREDLLGMRPLKRYEWLLEHHADLIVRVSINVLCSYLGISRNTLFSIRLRLSQKKPS